MPASLTIPKVVNGHRRGRVLIVDDDAAARDALQEACVAWGHEVVSASDGTEAFAVVAAFDPDVVLLDLGLPNLDGLEVAHRIRRVAGYGTFIIALTGWTEPYHRESAMRAGCNLFYSKPIHLDELQGILRALRMSVRA
jgi:DNA-binding response OmpR family regulator